MSDGEDYNRQGNRGSKPWRRSSTSPLHKPMVSANYQDQKLGPLCLPSPNCFEVILLYMRKP